ncbi:MAG: histidine--tRNA ligase [Burkholderiaceae bacterium]|nr:histidine--tRNA ligase [Burkholderiaceae bacterium]
MADNKLLSVKADRSPLVAVKGMNDLLPPDSARWEWLEDKVRALMARYGYANVRTPIVEPTALFVRGLGEVTDIVEKEMYSFEDAMNGDQLTLRPENTAGVVRAAVEHSMLYEGGKRLWYLGAQFRHERPQKGRYRQFHQFGAEALGFVGPDVDAELILMCRALWRELGLVEGGDVRLELNSLGQPDEREKHRAALIAHFEANAEALDDDARRRLYSNPLRILDSKNPAMKALVDAAPRLLDFLGAESMAHFDAVRAVLDAAGLAYSVNPRLVRGMDYYNLTVFEWMTDRLGAQGTICGGGRYDGLFAQLGGKPTPAVGFAAGLERVVLLLDELGLFPAPAAPAAYAIVPKATALPQAMVAVEALRAGGVAVLLNAGGGSMKSQFKRADASGAAYALIFGDDELARGDVALKALRDPQATQVTRRLADVAAWACELRIAQP